jgi:uncharacterized repeat protein (TIGR03943 family)
MVAAVRRDAQSVLLILVGGAILRISVSDIYLRYVKDGLRPFLLAAGAALLVLGIVGAVRDGLLRGGSRRGEAAAAADGNADGHGPEPATGAGPEDGHEHGHEHGHGHDHSRGPAVAWLLCLPVFAIFLIAPPALGSYAASRDAGTVAKPTGGSDYPPLPAGDPVAMSVGEYAVRAVWDKGRTLQDRSVAISGFVTPRKEGGWYLTRMVLNCCAADARALKVIVSDAPAPAADTWVELTGTWVASKQPISDSTLPVIRATNVRQIPQPRDPYG